MNKFNLLLTCFLLTCFLLICLSGSAQRQNLYFLKNDGRYVKQRDSADYLRIVQEPEDGTLLYKVNEYYLDGTQKGMGFSSKISPPSYEGKYTFYYKNGNVQRIANYNKGRLTDTSYNYYPNGKLYTCIIYINHPAPAGTTNYISAVKDSTGKDLVINGNGQCSFFDFDPAFKEVSKSGFIKNGVYDGVWTGKLKGGKIKYQETYADGKLISGESTDEQNVTVHYDKEDGPPVFKGGMEEFYKFLKKTVEYPPNCVKQRIQGVVQLKFLVQKDGSLGNIMVTNFVHPDLAAEAVRVLRLSPEWEPGMQKGRTVNAYHVVPISFTLR